MGTTKALISLFLGLYISHKQVDLSIPLCEDKTTSILVELDKITITRESEQRVYHVQNYAAWRHYAVFGFSDETGNKILRVSNRQRWEIGLESISPRRGILRWIDINKYDHGVDDDTHIDLPDRFSYRDGNGYSL